MLKTRPLFWVSLSFMIWPFLITAKDFGFISVFSPFAFILLMKPF
ncbi:hypothetical protein HMPREF1564_2812 [Providencia alcalifaciens R90-1475]|nr:hypothetical protein HMPREF1564_2812 [Providencia alcalifaciens R90-1475]